ncbi:transmembrane protein 258-like [Kogia breviceps]|uniref:transmembrane protein 258-like n=1 Tax=Kogia breviceps TaxID=27615 RepID=UPI002795E065|nr:transmembrane protein 258-like [Kogia breviceps]
MDESAGSSDGEPSLVTPAPRFSRDLLLQGNLLWSPKASEVESEALSRGTSPGNLAVLPHLTLALLATGMLFTAWFSVYEATSTKYARDVYKELLISLVASLLLGFAVLFPLLWVGIYV